MGNFSNTKDDSLSGSRLQDIDGNWLRVIADDEACMVAVTTRGDRVGVDSLTFDGFNLCHYTGDSPAHVAECRRRLASAVGVDESRIIVPRQVHSADVAVIDGDWSVADWRSLTEGVDGVVAKLKGWVVGVSTADCVPIILVDAVAGVVAAIHAGWRGVIGGVIENGIKAIAEVGADLMRVKAYIGPSICVDCFEVGEEVAERFPEPFVERRAGSRPHVDLPGYVAAVLIKEGISESNISSFTKDCCTRCHPSTYFSARAIGVKSGRNFMFAILK